MEILAEQTLQQELKSDLREAQMALKEWEDINNYINGDNSDNNNITVQDFEKMIKDGLEEEGILPTIERIQAVSGWVVTTVQDNGICVCTAIEESITSSIRELVNDYA